MHIQYEKSLNFSLKYVEKIHSMKQIEVKTDGTAEFELDMKLKDANSQIFLYKVSALNKISSNVINNTLSVMHFNLPIPGWGNA